MAGQRKFHATPPADVEECGRRKRKRPGPRAAKINKKRINKKTKQNKKRVDDRGSDHQKWAKIKMDTKMDSAQYSAKSIGKSGTTANIVQGT